MAEQHSRNPRAAARPHRSNAPTRDDKKRLGGPLCRNDSDVTGVGAVPNINVYARLLGGPSSPPNSLYTNMFGGQ
jgi:hypothetical protein